MACWTSEIDKKTALEDCMSDLACFVTVVDRNLLIELVFHPITLVTPEQSYLASCHYCLQAHFAQGRLMVTFVLVSSCAGHLASKEMFGILAKSVVADLSQSQA
mmetsp:Transcript_29772/g.41883  ORF Transcript_29772/g.41883 Transcript_29772/m.41883 type:complete len:104 (+) Transcript_29772:285-596(+)